YFSRRDLAHFRGRRELAATCRNEPQRVATCRNCQLPPPTKPQRHKDTKNAHQYSWCASWLCGGNAACRSRSRGFTSIRAASVAVGGGQGGALNCGFFYPAAILREAYDRNVCPAERLSTGNRLRRYAGGVDRASACSLTMKTALPD